MNEETFDWDTFISLSSTRYEIDGYKQEKTDLIRPALFSWFNEKRKEGCTISIARTRLDYSSTTYYPDSSYQYYRDSVDEVIYYTANLGRIDSDYSPSVENILNGEKILLLRKNNDYPVGRITYKLKETNENLVDYIKLETENRDLDFIMIDTELTDHFFDMLEYALVCLMD